MSEILHLEYESSGPSIRVTVDEMRTMTNEKGDPVTVVLVGGPGHPPAHFTFDALSALDAQLTKDLASVLARLEPIARAQGTAAVSDPAALVAMVADMTRQKQDLERAQQAHEVAVQAAQSVLRDAAAAATETKP